MHWIVHMMVHWMMHWMMHWCRAPAQRAGLAGLRRRPPLLPDGAALEAAGSMAEPLPIRAAPLPFGRTCYLYLCRRAAGRM
jgi:hypothetical protein